MKKLILLSLLLVFLSGCGTTYIEKDYQIACLVDEMYNGYYVYCGESVTSTLKEIEEQQKEDNKIIKCEKVPNTYLWREFLPEAPSGTKWILKD